MRGNPGLSWTLGKNGYLYEHWLRPMGLSPFTLGVWLQHMPILPGRQQTKIIKYCRPWEPYATAHTWLNDTGKLEEFDYILNTRKDLQRVQKFLNSPD